MSQTCRAMAKCIFGWGKQHRTMRKTKRRVPTRVAADFLLNLTAYNLGGILRLIAVRCARSQQRSECSVLQTRAKFSA